MTDGDGANEIDFLDVALTLAENVRTLIFVPLVTGLVALGISFLITPTYTATTRLLPPQPQQSAAATMLSNQMGALGVMAGAAAGIRNPTDTYVAMIKSRTVADKLLTRFKLVEVYGEKYDYEARNELAKRTKVTVGKDGIIVIEVEDRDAKQAAGIANAYVDELRELTLRLAVTEAAQRRLFFEDRLKQTKEELTKTEIALQGSGISDAALKTVPQTALETFARLKAQVTAQEIRLGAMRGYMTESNPDFKQAQQELAALRAELSKIEHIDTAKTKGAGAEYLAKFRDFKYQETLFELMARQYEAARLDEAREGALVQVLDAAIPPTHKSAPQRALIASVGALAALLVVVFVIFVRRALERMAKDARSTAKLDHLRRLLRR